MKYKSRESNALNAEVIGSMRQRAKFAGILNAELVDLRSETSRGLHMLPKGKDLRDVRFLATRIVQFRHWSELGFKMEVRVDGSWEGEREETESL